MFHHCLITRVKIFFFVLLPSLFLFLVLHVFLYISIETRFISFNILAFSALLVAMKAMRDVFRKKCFRDSNRDGTLGF